jgi:hypothetical protein
MEDSYLETPTRSVDDHNNINNCKIQVPHAGQDSFQSLGPTLFLVQFYRHGESIRYLKHEIHSLPYISTNINGYYGLKKVDLVVGKRGHGTSLMIIWGCQHFT